MQCLLKHNILSYYVRFFWFHFSFFFFFSYWVLLMTRVIFLFALHFLLSNVVDNVCRTHLLCGYYALAICCDIWSHYTYFYGIIHYVSRVLFIYFSFFIMFRFYCFWFLNAFAFSSFEIDFVVFLQDAAIVRILIFHRKYFNIFFCYQIN